MMVGWLVNDGTLGVLLEYNYGRCQNLSHSKVCKICL
jgi:hypothetical protein